MFLSVYLWVQRDQGVFTLNVGVLWNFKTSRCHLFVLINILQVSFFSRRNHFNVLQKAVEKITASCPHLNWWRAPASTTAACLLPLFTPTRYTSKGLEPGFSSSCQPRTLPTTSSALTLLPWFLSLSPSLFYLALTNIYTCVFWFVSWLFSHSPIDFKFLKGRG